MTKLAFMGYNNKWVFIVGGSHACIQQADAVLLFWLWFFLLPNLSYSCPFCEPSFPAFPMILWASQYSVQLCVFFSFKTARDDFYYLQPRTLIYVPVFKNLFKHLSHVLCFCHRHLNTPLSAKQEYDIILEICFCTCI